MSAAFPVIALTLSGGGYRAAAFHLGVLRSLHALGLLSHVKFLSTASGGTLLGARWLAGQSRAVPEDFAAFDAAMCAFLESENVVKQSVDALATRESPSLIRNAADVYDRLVDGLRWGALSRGSLDEVVFNATDFDTGGGFRFVKSNNPAVWVGNRAHKVADADLAQMRVADVMAASSCFPGAFEPIVFPRDFDDVPQTQKDPIPLMDGGIYDNQAVSSLLLLFKRAQPPQIDLFLIADAEQKQDVYEEPAPPPVPFGSMTLGAAYHAALGLAAIAVLGAVGGGTAALTATTPLDRVLAISSALPCALAALLFGWVRFSLWPRVVAQVPYRNAGVWAALQGLTLDQAAGLAARRVTSVLALTMRAFMRRIRDLTYERVFSTPELKGKVCSALVYSLKRHDDEAVRALARRAAATPTSLWFEDRATRDAVLRCGELTACHVLRERLRAMPQRSSAEEALLTAVTARWQVVTGGP